MKPTLAQTLRELEDARAHGHLAKGEAFTMLHRGGLEGTARVRELRAMGYVIEAHRPRRHLILGREPGRWYYRLVSAPIEQLELWPADG